GQVDQIRRVRVYAARQGRPGAHLQAAGPGRWQAGRERRRRRRGRTEDPGGDHRDRRPRQAGVDAGDRRRVGDRGNRRRLTPHVSAFTRTLLGEDDGGLVRRSGVHSGLRIVTAAGTTVRAASVVKGAATG